MKDLINLLHKKLFFFRKEAVISSDPGKQFELGERCAEVQSEIAGFEAQLEEIEPDPQADRILRAALDEIKAISVEKTDLCRVYNACLFAFDLLDESPDDPADVHEAISRLFRYDSEKAAFVFAQQVMTFIAQHDQKTHFEKWMKAALQKLKIDLLEINKLANRLSPVSSLLVAIKPKKGKVEKFTLEAWLHGAKSGWKSIVWDEYGFDERARKIEDVEKVLQDVISHEHRVGRTDFSVELILSETHLFYDARKICLKNKRSTIPLPISHLKPVTVRWLERFSDRKKGESMRPWREKWKVASAGQGTILFQDSHSNFDIERVCNQLNAATNAPICVGLGFKPDKTDILLEIFEAGTPIVLWFLRALQRSEIEAFKKDLLDVCRPKDLPSKLYEIRQEAANHKRSDHWSHSVVLLYDDYDRVPPGHGQPLPSPA
jgi:hypothetical protein